MGQFVYGGEAVEIEPTTDIVLRRLPLQDGDREQFTLHRLVTYSRGAEEPDGPFTYTVPPADEEFVSDLASVPQLLTWLVPKSGRHLPAALIHDALVDDPDIDRFAADRLFRDAMGDLDVGFIRRWLMWTAVSLKTIQKRGTRSLKVATIVTAAAVVVLGSLATVNLVTERTFVPWMGSRHWAVELVLGLAGAVVIPMVLGVVLWRPIRIAGVIAGVGMAVLLHVMALTGGVYAVYSTIERLPRRIQIVFGLAVLLGSAAAFTWGVVTALG